MMARIGMMRALNYGKPEPAIGPRRNAARGYKLIS
jgi:hypothetical protein